MPLIQFSVECKTDLGESLVVVGDAPQVGSWDPSKSKVVLSTGPNTYPTWSAEVELASGSTLEFKFVVLKDGGARWEASVPNRKLTVPSASVTVKAKFDRAGEKMSQGGGSTGGYPSAPAQPPRENGNSGSEPSVPAPSPLSGKGSSAPAAPGAAADFARRLGAEDAKKKSYREKLDLGGALLKEVAGSDLAGLGCLQAYLSFVASGQLKCVEDGSHHRPNHAANVSKSMTELLRKLSKEGDAEAFIARRIFPSLPSFAEQFTVAVPMTRIRDIAHRGDIPHDLKQEIKHTLQNKLHRCADPGDLETCRKLVERIQANRGNYSQPFVEQLEIFYEELKEFFNASNVDDLVRKVAMKDDSCLHIAQHFMWVKGEGRDPFAQLDALTELRTATVQKRETSQDWQLLDIELEKYAFTLLSGLTSQFEHNPHQESCERALRSALRQMVLSAVCAVESHVVVRELEALPKIGFSDSFRSLRLLASSERCLRMCFNLQQQLSQAYSSVVVLGDVLAIDKHAAAVFLEAELRASVLFQVSKLAQVLVTTSKRTAGLPNWVAIRPGTALGRVIKVRALDELWSKTIPKEGAVAFCETASGEEEITPGVCGVVVQRDLPVLSHLAVRARQLGVVFACTAEVNLFQEKARVGDGSPCKLVVANSGDVEVTQVGAEALAASNGAAGKTESKGAAKATVGQLNLKETEVLAIDQADRATPSTVGAKAASAGKLQALAAEASSQGKFKTPTSCAIPFGAMSKVVSGPGLESMATMLQSALANKDPKAAEEMAAELRSMVAKLHVNPPILKAVAAAFKAKTRVAVRSSANSEDLENVSGAGLHDSVLEVDVSSADALEKAILQVWGSLFTLRAVQSRFGAGLPIFKGISMGVLVQEMATASMAGGETYAFIMFSEHVAANDPSRAYIELCVGLGETLASAAVPGTPYRISVQKEAPHKVDIHSLGSFSSAFQGGASGLESVSVDYSTVPLSQDPKQLEAIGQRLAAVALRVEKSFGCGMDMEGVVVGTPGSQEVFLVQARPIVKAAGA
mmetsp:Transcript_58292/g.138915  ORF Transcript_58292/g.138915 Transcript_58292/m.138915 type:complete len:1034 (-) Transcript_58292:125-3226(-)